MEPRNEHPPAPASLELDAINRRAELEGTAAAEMARAPGNIAAVAGDLDELKDVNDTEGHASGDEYIKTCRDVLQASVRHPDDRDPGQYRGDIIAERRAIHTSGDEYWIILRGVSTQEGVDAFIKRMQAVLDDYGIGISMGGRVHRPGETVADIRDDADALMQANKMERTLAKYSLTPEKEAAFKEHIVAIRELGVASLRVAQKVVDALDWRDEPDRRR